MAELKLNPEVADGIGNWVENTLANVECSIEHEASVTHLIIEDDKASIPFTYRAAGVHVEGTVRFNDLDYFAEIIGHYAKEGKDDSLLEQMTSIAKSKESQNYLLSLKKADGG